MAQEIRNYRFTCELIIARQKCEGCIDPKEEIIQAYDLNEALVQFGIKYQDYEHAKVLEVIPFKYAEEQKPVIEQKKQVHVKPNPVRTK